MKTISNLAFFVTFAVMSSLSILTEIIGGNGTILGLAALGWAVVDAGSRVAAAIRERGE